MGVQNQFFYYMFSYVLFCNSLIHFYVDHIFVQGPIRTLVRKCVGYVLV